MNITVGIGDDLELYGQLQIDHTGGEGSTTAHFGWSGAEAALLTVTLPEGAEPMLPDAADLQDCFDGGAAVDSDADIKSAV